jgi:hypothetical protein
MRLLSVALSSIVLAFAAFGATAFADQPAPTTFVVVLNADNEVPHCGPSTNAARGQAVFHVTDEATGTVEWHLVANNLPGNIVAAHIHLAPQGVAPRRHPRERTALLRERSHQRVPGGRDPRPIRRPRPVAQLALAEAGGSRAACLDTYRDGRLPPDDQPPRDPRLRPASSS